MGVEGAFVQGQGFFTTEEVLVDEAIGKLLSFDTVSLLHGTANKQGVLSSKYDPHLLSHCPHPLPLLSTLSLLLLRRSLRSTALSSSGEPPLLLAVSIHSAILHAIAAARHQFAH
ncbi:unnamed protein product [Closterium sp. Naga37s-1]|nr:unnamed protein product [Closterium sp. Naga37s-1]